MIGKDKRNDLKILVNHLEEAARKIALKINEEKTEYTVEYMVMGRSNSTGKYSTLRVSNYNFKRVKQFKYLGL